MRTGKGRRRLFPYIASLPLSPKNLKKPDTTHSLFIKKKDAPNGVILDGTMHLLLPLDAHRQGKKKIVPLHRLSPSLS